MIFALYDFVKYWFHIGIYSDNGLQKEGAIIASPEILKKIEEINYSSLSVHTRNSFLSWLVLYYTGPTIWSHTSMTFEGGILFEVTTKGGIKHHISDYFDGKTYLGIFSIPLEHSELEKVRLSAELTIPGCKFAWKEVIYFGLLIILARDDHYRLRYSMDLIILLLLFFFPWNIFFLKILSLSLITIYSLVVLFNRWTFKGIQENEISNYNQKEGIEHVVPNRENMSIPEIIKTIKENPFDSKYNALLGCSDEIFKDLTEQTKEVFSNSPKYLLSIFNENANLLSSVKRYDRAKICYEEALKTCENSSLNKTIDHAYTLNNYAGIFAKTEQINIAKEIMHEAITIVNNSNEELNEKAKILESFSNNLLILSSNSQD
ncbi:MAG: tetratricopeptide repeat protein [Sedimentisphaerales bacterium]|nr:tetratricopeptide repeat protein [Sedimentisphaerales bacterium]